MASSKQAKSTTTTSSVLTSKINHGSDKGKADAMSTSKGINGILPNNRGSQSAERTSDLVTNHVLELECCIKQWIPCISRKGGEIYVFGILFTTSDFK